MKRAGLVIFAIAGASACGESGIQRDNCFLATPEVPSEGCTDADRKRFVDGVMRSHYLWSDQLPEVTLDDFETARDLLSFYRESVEPRDRFSYITTLSQETGYFEEGKTLGFGINTRFIDDALMLAQVYGSQEDESESPASAAGLRRGDRILAMDGRTVEELLEAGELNAAFGAREPGVTVSFRLRAPDGTEREVSVTKDFYVFDPVAVARVIERDGRRVGYVMLRSFVEPAAPQLRQAFFEFGEAEIDDLVLDLRYNSGGLISVARTLSNLILGRAADGEVMWRRVYNESNQSCMELDRFARVEGSLGSLERVVALTLGGTASASEQTISGLQPHIETLTVGTPSYGKPFGQLGFRYCGDEVLRPVTFQTVNADWDGDYYDGIQPTCAAQDLVDAPFGDPEEAMLAAALERLETGACAPDKSIASGGKRRRSPDRTLRDPTQPEGAELLF